MSVRPSAIFPFVTSSVAFALILVLILSGRNPDFIPDGFFLNFNTTSVGQNLVQFSSAAPVTATTNSGVLSHRSIIARFPDPQAPTVATSTSSSVSTAAPTLEVPQTSGTPNPTAIPVALIATFFQLLLNTFASGVGDTLQGIVTLLVTNGKTTLGVSQYYTVHLTGVCGGSVFDPDATKLTTPFNLTSCYSYAEIGAYAANFTSTVSSSTLIGAANVTVPFLSKVPALGKQGESIIDLISNIVLAVFVIGLIGNGLSICLSIAAFLAPEKGIIHTTGAGITMLSSQLLQSAALTSKMIAISARSSINSFSDVSGLTASVGGKFLVLIWFGYISAQMANGYWMTTWFAKFRETSYKARRRTMQQRSGYKGVWQELLSDLRLPKAGYEEEDTEKLIQQRLNGLSIKHWDDDVKRM